MVLTIFGSTEKFFKQLIEKKKFFLNAIEFFFLNINLVIEKSSRFETGPAMDGYRARDLRVTSRTLYESSKSKIFQKFSSAARPVSSIPQRGVPRHHPQLAQALRFLSSEGARYQTPPTLFPLLFFFPASHTRSHGNGCILVWRWEEVGGGKKKKSFERKKRWSKFLPSHVIIGEHASIIGWGHFFLVWEKKQFSSQFQLVGNYGEGCRSDFREKITSFLNRLRFVSNFLPQPTYSKVVRERFCVQKADSSVSLFRDFANLS